jgi:hypothetical protein
MHQVVLLPYLDPQAVRHSQFQLRIPFQVTDKYYNLDLSWSRICINRRAT